MNSVVVTTGISVLLGLISIGSATAFNDLLSLTINGLYSSYFVVCALLLWRRSTGFIKTMSEAKFVGDSPRRITNAPGTKAHLVWGYWRLPARLGICVNTFACVFMIIIIFFSFWPPTVAPTASTMNYSCLVTGSVAITSVIYYNLWARKTYNGPLVEVEV